MPKFEFEGDWSPLWQMIDAKILRRIAGSVPTVITGTYQKTVSMAGRVFADINARYGERLRDVEVAQPYGLATLPPTADSPAIEVVLIPIMGSGAKRIVLGEIDRERPNIQSGEVVLYNRVTGAVAATIRMGATGGIEITSKAGTLINLNGGSNGVARVGDDVAGTVDMAAWMLAVSTFINAAAPGTITSIPAGIGVIATGSATVKAGG